MHKNEHPLIWGHRGASGHAPENTLPAFQLAADMGADGVELDVQLTRDGIPVICHDETVDRTSNGAGWLKDFTYSEIRKLDFSCGNAAYEGVRIPALEEVLDLLAPTGLTINIEIKTGIIFYDRSEEIILKLVRDRNWEDRIIYSSFNHYTVRRIKELDPSAKPVTAGASARTHCIPPSTTFSILISWKTAGASGLTSTSGLSIPHRN